MYNIDYYIMGCSFFKSNSSVYCLNGNTVERVLEKGLGIGAVRGLVHRQTGGQARTSKTTQLGFSCKVQEEGRAVQGGGEKHACAEIFMHASCNMTRIIA